MSPSPSRVFYRHRLTRLGLHFLFVAVFAVVGGALRGFNLLLILSGLLFAVLIVQWRQGRGCIRRVRLRREPTPPVAVGSTISLAYRVSNVSRWLPIWMLKINDTITPINVPETEPDSSYERDEGDVWKAAPVIGGIGLIPASGTRTTEVECRFASRGEYRLGPVETSTNYPFALMSCERLHVSSASKLNQVASLFVYPEPLKLRRGWQRLLPPRRGGDGVKNAGNAGHNGEFYGVRRWQSGDHIKQIHWRTTARIGEPAVRQVERRPHHQVAVLMDGFRTTADDHERLLQFTVSVLKELVGTLEVNQLRGMANVTPVSIVIADQLSAIGSGNRRVMEFGGQPSISLESNVLSRLATSMPTGDRATLLQTVTENASKLSGSDLVVLSHRSLDSVMKENEARGVESKHSAKGSKGREVVGYLALRNRLTWLDLRSPMVTRWITEQNLKPLASKDRVGSQGGR
ncbi:MAG: DUF58 domain-containing protein [Planctomycetota bacterium]